MNEFKPDYVGFVFAGKKRRVTPLQAAALAKKLDKSVMRVGVFANEDVKRIDGTVRIAGLDAVQLHGDETAAAVKALRSLLPHGVRIWKAVRVCSSESIQAALKLGADCLLLDSFSPAEYGGTGKMADFGLIKKAKLSVPFFLAGGLNAGNIMDAIREVSPLGVDISSGIETDGVKDRRKIKEIIEILRNNNLLEH
ncbi:MAG TPA: N-(5'-phosphoribosyl)anthranilate isomerase [Ruminococcaceae bacterium]|jgi:phosphoribosylanthranilate isomerase|nr:N-(5'-phosphoribosyl)anthranilate isomerase [Oscillospiraceae bacterium]